MLRWRPSSRPSNTASGGLSTHKKTLYMSCYCDVYKNERLYLWQIRKVFMNLQLIQCSNYFHEHQCESMMFMKIIWALNELSDWCSWKWYECVTAAHGIHIKVNSLCDVHEHERFYPVAGETHGMNVMVMLVNRLTCWIWQGVRKNY